MVSTWSIAFLLEVRGISKRNSMKFTATIQLLESKANNFPDRCVFSFFTAEMQSWDNLPWGALLVLQASYSAR